MKLGILHSTMQGEDLGQRVCQCLEPVKAIPKINYPSPAQRTRYAVQREVWWRLCRAMIRYATLVMIVAFGLKVGASENLNHFQASEQQRVPVVQQETAVKKVLDFLFSVPNSKEYGKPRSFWLKQSNVFLVTNNFSRMETQECSKVLKTAY